MKLIIYLFPFSDCDFGYGVCRESIGGDDNDVISHCLLNSNVWRNILMFLCVVIFSFFI